MELKDLLPNVISSFAILLSIYTLWKSSKVAKGTNSVPALIDYFREWRSENGVHESYDYIAQHFTDEDIKNNEKLTFDTIKDPDKKKHARRVSHYFDNLGLLSYSGVLEEEYLLAFIGASANRSWTILKTYIENERVRRIAAHDFDRHYQRHFQYFASQYRKKTNSIDRELDKATKNFAPESKLLPKDI